MDKLFSLIKKYYLKSKSILVLKVIRIFLSITYLYFWFIAKLKLIVKNIFSLETYYFKNLIKSITNVYKNRNYIFLYIVTTIFAVFCSIYIASNISLKLYGELDYSISENFIADNIIRNLSEEGMYVKSGNISFKDRHLNIAVDNFIVEKGVFMDARDFYISIDFLKAIFGIIDIKSLNLVINRATFDFNQLEKNKSKIYKDTKDMIYAFKMSFLSSLKKYGNIEHIVVKFDELTFKYGDMKYLVTDGIFYNSLEDIKRYKKIYGDVAIFKGEKKLGKERVKVEMSQINDDFFGSKQGNKFNRIEVDVSNIFRARGLVNIVDKNISGYMNFIDVDAQKMKYYNLLSDDFGYNKKVSVFAKIKKISFHRSEADLKINLSKEEINANLKLLSTKLITTLKFDNIGTLDAIDIWPASAGVKARTFIRDHILGNAKGKIIIDTMFNENMDTNVKIDMHLNNAKLHSYLDLPDFNINVGYLTLNNYIMNIKYKDVYFGGNGCDLVKSENGNLNINFNPDQPILNIVTNKVDGDICAIKKNFYDENQISEVIRDVVSYSNGKYLGEFGLSLDFNKESILQNIVLNGKIKDFKSYYKGFRKIESDEVDVTISEKYLTMGGEVHSGIFDGKLKVHYDIENNAFNSTGKGVISKDTLGIYNINHLINSDEDMDFSFDVKNKNGFVKFGLSNKQIKFFDKYEKNKNDMGLLKVSYNYSTNDILKLGVNLDIVGNDNVKVDLKSVVKSGRIKLLSINEYNINDEIIRGYYYDKDDKNSDVKINFQNMKITKVKEVFDVVANKNNIEKIYNSFTFSDNAFNKVAKIKVKERDDVTINKKGLFDNKKLDIIIYGKNIENAKNNIANYMYINSIYDNHVIKKFDMDILYGDNKEFGKVRYTPNAIYAKTNNFSNLYSMLFSDDAFTGGNVLITGASDKKGEPIKGKIVLNNFIVNGDQKISKLRYLSITGIFSSLKNNGIRFLGGSGNFNLDGGKFNTNNITVYGDGVGISTLGDVDFVNGDIDLKGSVVTGYSISKVISSIPIVGQILTGLDKTSIFTTSYSLKGNVVEDNVKVKILASSYAPGILKDFISKITGNEIVPLNIPSDIFRLKETHSNVKNNFNLDR